ncbi:hypothetical protein [Paenibacillus sp. Z3-2]
MALTPNPPGTLIRLTIGPSVLSILGLNVAIPTGATILVTVGDLKKLTHLTQNLSAASISSLRSNHKPVLIKRNAKEYQLTFNRRRK